jgi:hypothetical protein
MNAYWIDAGYVPVYGDLQYNEPGYFACGVFIAESPAQAKYDALRWFNHDVEWNDLSCRLLVKGVNVERGYFDDTWPDGPWYEDDSIPPPEPYKSISEALSRVKHVRSSEIE